MSEIGDSDGYLVGGKKPTIWVRDYKAMKMYSDIFSSTAFNIKIDPVFLDNYTEYLWENK